MSPTVEKEPQPVSLSVDVEDGKGYSWELILDLDAPTASTSIEDSAPGKAKVEVVQQGTFTMTNATSGRKSRIPWDPILLTLAWRKGSSFCKAEQISWSPSERTCFAYATRIETANFTPGMYQKTVELHFVDMLYAAPDESASVEVSLVTAVTVDEEKADALEARLLRDPPTVTIGSQWESWTPRLCKVTVSSGRYVYVHATSAKVPC